MISSITINNFRGIDNLTVENFGKINVFVGKNNSGKTTLLEALFLITGINNPLLAVVINSNRGYSQLDNTGISLLYHDFTFSRELKISAVLTPEEKRELTISVGYNKTSDTVNGNSATALTASNFKLSPKGYSGSSIQYSVSQLNYNFSVESRNNNKKYLSSLEIVSQDEANYKLADKYKERLLGTILYKNLQLETKNLEKVIVEKKMSDLIKVLQRIEPKIKSIELGSEDKILCDIGFDTLIPIQVMGDGIIKTIAIISAISTVQNGVLFIDELENGLHYSALKIMWSAIKEAADFYNVQIFATTHSYECLNALQKTIDEFNVYRIEKHDGLTKTVHFDAEELEGMIEHGWEVR